MNFLLVVTLIVLAFRSCNGQGIPNYLIPCYRANNTQNFIAQSDQVLLQLIRKIEDAMPTSLDIRTLSASLFHRLRFDGVQKAVGVTETEFVTPYRNNGIMAPRLELMKRLISVRGSVAFEEILSETELCDLHKLISYSVEPFERGDETRTCPTHLKPAVDAPWITGNIKMINDSFRYGGTTRNIVKFGRGVSRCPIEMGVTHTDYYGDVSFGTLIGAIAAGLEPQLVQISDLIGSYSQYANLESMGETRVSRQLATLFRNLNTIDNKLAAGLAGNLAQVCVLQTPYVGSNFVLGTSAVWNDTLFPRARFLEDNHQARWEFPEAEILAGLDSYFISNNIRDWVNQLRRLRLSQVVDMYYNSRGIPVRAIETSGHKSKAFGNMKDYASILKERTSALSSDAEIMNACDRLKILESLDVQRLREETYNFASVLQFTATSFYITEEKLRTNCDLAVTSFMGKARSILSSMTKCNNIPKPRQETSVDLQLAIDGSRREYENLQLINHVAHISQMSSYGTVMNVIHGTTGEMMSNKTNNLVAAFEELRNFTGPYPTTINLSLILQTVLATLRNQTNQEASDRRICAPSHVVLIVSQGSRVGSTDFISAQRMITTTFQRFPDLYFIFVTNDKISFLDLTRNITAPSHWSGNQERFNQLIYPEHFVVIETPSSTNPLHFSERLAKELKRIPKRIMAPFCQNEEDRERLHKQNILFRPDQYEDYVGPNQEILYRISPFYFRYAKHFNVQFHGVGYGDLTICQSRVLNRAPDFCQSLKGTDVAWFNYTAPCLNPMDCPSLYYSVSMDVSRMRCTENDCRYPDQVRYIIRHSGLTCENDPNSAFPLVVGRGLLNASWIFSTFIIIYLYDSSIKVLTQ